MSFLLKGMIVEQPGKMTPELTSGRPRGLYLFLIGIVILLGLASRRYGTLLPGLLHKNTGDILWATLVFLLFGLLLPKRSTAWIALLAAAFSLAIEFGKFYHASWLDVVRDTTPGRLVFGYAFSWSNLLCYLIGIGIGILLEQTIRLLIGRRRPSRQ